jgi:hypothetical protein
MEKQCTLCSQCHLFRDIIHIPEDVRLRYKFHYCANHTGRWKDCKRFSFEKLFGYCPDFVMPNSLLTTDQIKTRSVLEFSFAD